MRASTLVALMAPGAVAVTVLGLFRAVPGSSVRLAMDGDPGVRVVGLALVGCGWFTLRFCPGVSIGLRRFVARVSAAGLVLAGACHLAGPEFLTTLDPWLPLGTVPGARTLAAALGLCVATSYAWASSPLRR